MTTIDDIARAALLGDNLLLRSLCQDFLEQYPELSECPPPITDDFSLTVVAASLIELLAERKHQSHPLWTHNIGALPEPVYLIKAAASMKRLKALCDQESPEALRKRKLLAPPNFLSFA